MKLSADNLLINCKLFCHLFSVEFSFIQRQGTHRWPRQETRFNLKRNKKLNDVTMKWCAIFLLAAIAVQREQVAAKPGFQGVPELTLNSILYQHETHRDYHLKNGVEFVNKQIVKTSDLNTNIAKNSILFLGDGMSVPTLAATRVYIGGKILPNISIFIFSMIIRLFCPFL